MKTKNILLISILILTFMNGVSLALSTDTIEDIKVSIGSGNVAVIKNRQLYW